MPINNTLTVLGNTFIHLDMDADRNGSKKVSGSTEKGSYGRISTRTGLIDEIKLASRDKTPQNKAATRVLKSILKKLMRTENHGFGKVPVYGKIGRKAEKILRKMVGKDWIATLAKQALSR